MRRFTSCLLFLVVVLTLGIGFVPSLSVEAKGSFSKIVVFTGIGGSLMIDDPALLEFFSFSDFSHQIAWPAVPGEGLLITRYENDQNTGEDVAVDHLWIYPPSENRGPFVYYQGLVNGSSEYDGRLFEGDREAWMKLQTLINASRQPPSANSQFFPLILAGLSGLAIGLFMSWVFLRERSARIDFSA